MSGAKGRALTDLAIGQPSRIARICCQGAAADDLEARLMELGFVEGEEVEVLHVGPLGRDPLAVRVGGAVVALRRREAQAVIVSE